ncbi:MAG: hypothetical protein HQ472_03405 [Ignavibacteria bacterium]|nr:hypothetical protein [Ignavibacteria bacterium]
MLFEKLSRCRVTAVIVLLLGIMLCFGSNVQAQLISPFLPTDCVNAAKTAANAKIPNSQLIAIASIGFDVDVLGTNVYTGMKVETGLANVWIYVFRSTTPKDTAVAILQARALGSCIDPSSLIGATNLDIPLGNLGSTPVPATYLKGTALFAALNSSNSFKAFHAKYKSAEPTVVALGTVEQSVPGFDVGTSAWLLTWSPDSTDPSSGMTCVVDSKTGKTFCLGDELLSVNEDPYTEDCKIYPNPAAEIVYVTLPGEMLNDFIRVDAINLTGEEFELFNGRSDNGQMLALNIRLLAPGAYTFRLRGLNTYRSIPLTVVK